jgi:nucleotide-binding universal stress UspA family protein
MQPFGWSPRADDVELLTVLTDDVGLNERQLVEQTHRDLVRQIEECGGSAGSRIDRGDPTEVITRIAQKETTTLIIVGKHGKRWMTSKAFGTTAARICETAGRPVLMVSPRKE